MCGFRGIGCLYIFIFFKFGIFIMNVYSICYGGMLEIVIFLLFWLRKNIMYVCDYKDY